MKSHYSRFATAVTVVLVLLIIRFPLGMGMGSDPDTPYDFRSNGDPVVTELQEESKDLLLRFNNAMVNLADVAKPTVVMVSTERTVRARSSGSMFDFFGPFRDDPFFRDHPFFRDRGRGQEREYQQRGLGSGVIVSDDGYILTNHHVIAQADTIKVTLINQREIPATVVGSDPRTDVAVLKINAENLPYMRFGDSEELQVGEMVMAIGSPLGAALAHTVTQGIVSAKGRDLELLGSEGYENFIQTDAAINRGNSGGPLINMRGELIGINTAIASQSGGFQGIGFAIPSNMARNVMESIIQTGRVVRGYIGIRFQPMSESIARALELPDDRGVLVTEVQSESPAEAAGIQPEDVITRFNGRRIDSGSDFRRNVAEKMPGTEITLTLVRDGQEIELSVTLDEMPTDDLASVDQESIREIIGFSVTELTPEIAEHLRLRSNVEGVVVEEVDRNSAAAQNGLQQGDVIVALNRLPVTSVVEFNEAISAMETGESLLLQVIRGNSRLFIAFELQSS
ncbi:DegQ family serine endoprotease [Balneolales bacterium ANBcel1]|nr:DegQ family serine endoprotease [Balneolales bacterium ANBcel1]